MKLFKYFNKKASAAVAGIALLATATIQPKAVNSDPDGLYNDTKYGWNTMTEAGAYKDVTAKARDFLLSADPAFKEVITDTALVFVDPQDKNDSRSARFSMTPGKDRIVILYKNDNMHENNYAFFSKIHANQENAPSKDEFKTMGIALDIANESAHYWQSRGNAELILKLFKDGIACNDRMALEQSSDIFMISTAVKLHNNLQGDDSAAKRLKHAIEWSMQSLGFYDFSDYVKEPKTSKSQAMLEDFMKNRDKEYRVHIGCDLKDPSPISPDAQQALKGVQQKL